MNYLVLKHLHMSLAVVSGSFFLIRGLWMLLDSPLLRQRWVRIAPHVVDTALLLSAIGLAAWIRQYPFGAPWLTAKVLALIAYIGLGTIALKRGRTKTTRIFAFVAALACFAYIVAVAMTKNPFLVI